MKIHVSITAERIIDAVQADDNLGFCIACGEEATGCEPDMRNGKCEVCGENQVFGAEELLIEYIP